ncbi:putative receptor-like protein kinase At3g47110 [Dioscorea cayenensis subsp. rotundata]|uniref:Receptor-like protein kinase At3g47110 n=1 Tax=Dioscorea cayennensis subsp. rotundata TaxID=55577 RepID=A0AB40D260_DIOCR|nr:putative receptor-like protein kinase At3g47110 [Dioscorea cayenensis subsp. rotundata]
MAPPPPGSPLLGVSGKDPWLFEVPLAYKPTYLNVFADMHVNNLSDLFVGDHWDFDLINNILGDSLCSLVKSNCSVDWGGNNFWVWHPSPKKMKISSAIYHYLNHESKSALNWEGWHKLWSLRIAPRVKHFIWLLQHGRISTTDYLNSINLGPRSLCIFCNLELESIEHIFLDCCKVQSVWNLINHSLGCNISFPDFISTGCCKFEAESALDSEIKALGIALRSSLDYSSSFAVLGNPSLVEIPGRWNALAYALSATGANLHNLNLFLTGRDLPRKATRLSFISIYGNLISGTLPSSLFNLTSLYYLAMADNKFHGSLPSDMGVTLPNLQTALSGSIPVSFGALHELVWFNFGNNSLQVDQEVGMGFITSLTNCTSLQVLGLDSNQFRGMLPNSVANLSSRLIMLNLGSNQLYGTFPNGIENYANLTLLSLERNMFSGSIPVGIGKSSNLQKLFLYGNRFSGQIPSFIGNLTQLYELLLQENSLSGRIPYKLGSCKHLKLLNLSSNQLSGTILT